MPQIMETCSGIRLFERLLKIFLQNAEIEDSLTLWNLIASLSLWKKAD